MMGTCHSCKGHTSGTAEINTAKIVTLTDLEEISDTSWFNLSCKDEVMLLHRVSRGYFWSSLGCLLRGDCTVALGASAGPPTPSLRGK